MRTISFEKQVDIPYKAIGTLLACGALLGVSTNLAKVAIDRNIEVLPFLMWSLMGAGLILLIVSAIKGIKLPVDNVAIRYYFIAAFFSVAGSNLIFFHAVSHVGVSFVALTMSLPPLLTYIAALTLKMEKFCFLRASGVALALIGTVILVASKWSSPNGDQFWVILTLLGPVLAAAGNIYRTSYWPAGAKAESLAPGMLLAASVSLFIAGFISPALPLTTSINANSVVLILIQSIVFAGQFKLLFLLQKAGGPVFLSLIGGVSAAIGIPIAVVLLREDISIAIIPSALFIITGIMCMVKSQAMGK